MKKILVSLAAAAVLVAGIATASVISGSSAEAQEATTDEESTDGDRPRHGSAIEDVLADLVEAGEITQAQSDTITAALEEKREELKANRPEGEGRRGRGFGRGGPRGNLAELLEDGVIDAAELAELPEGHPLTDPDGPFAEALEDGEITEDELQEIRGERQGHRRDRFGTDGVDVEGINV